MITVTQENLECPTQISKEELEMARQLAIVSAEFMKKVPIRIKVMYFIRSTLRNIKRRILNVKL